MAAGVVAAALGPADERKGLQPALSQPAALLPRREVDIGVGPLPRPVVLGPVETGGAQPVLQRQLVAVVDAESPLLRAVDEEQPAELPERLTTDVVGVLLVDDQHAAPAFNQLTGGDQAGQPGTHHDHISVSHGRQCSGLASGGVCARGIRIPVVHGRHALMHQREVDGVEHGLPRSRPA